MCIDPSIRAYDYVVIMLIKPCPPPAEAAVRHDVMPASGHQLHVPRARLIASLYEDRAPGLKELSFPARIDPFPRLLRIVGKNEKPLSILRNMQNNIQRLGGTIANVYR